MSRIPRLLVVCTLLVGCASADDAEERALSALEVEPGEELDPGAEELAGATDERPCAENTLAHLALPNGNPASFCASPGGLDAYIEIDDLNERSYVEEIGLRDAADMCAVDIYMAVTDRSKPLPRGLLDACPEELRRRDDYGTRELVRDYFETVVPPPSRRGNFCGAGGQAAFQAQCMTCAPYDDCIPWCKEVFWGAHQRTMTNPDFLGEEGNAVWETNASCFGTTLVRMWERWDEGDAWGSPDLQVTVQSGKSFFGGIHHQGLFQDYDFRARGDSASGALHRHTGVFVDD